MGNKYAQNNFLKKGNDSETYQPGFGFTKIKKSSKPNKPIRQRLTIPFSESQNTLWETLHKNSKTQKYIICPIKKKTKEKLLEEKKIKLTFLYNNLTLKKFLELNQNQLIPEILLLNFISNISSALKSAQKLTKNHLNLSLETIYLTDQSNWLISPPNPDFLNLMARIEFQDEKELKFLLTSFYDVETHSGKFDIFCLGVLVLHFVYPFSQSQRMAFLTEEAIERRMNFLRGYYSKGFVGILEGCVRIDVEGRFGVDEVVRGIREVFGKVGV